MKILVTGCAGFIGHAVTRLLLSQGHEVVGVDNMDDYYDVSLKEYRLFGLLRKKNFTFRRVDVARQIMTVDFPAYDAIIHLAAKAGVRNSIENPREYIDTNITGTYNILEIMTTRHKIKKIVLASTSSLYSGNTTPFTENMNTDNPLSPYAATKKAAEALAYTYHHLYGIDVSVLRYFTVYGPMGRPDMAIYKFIEAAIRGEEITIYGDGNHKRDFTYIDDVADATVKALMPVGYEVFNIGAGDDPVSINDAIKEILPYRETVSVKHEPALKSDMFETHADNTKAREILGWKPETKFSEGIKKTVEWHLS